MVHCFGKKAFCLVAVITTVFGAVSGSCAAEELPEAQISAPPLIFEDNFDGSELDPDKWMRCPEMIRCEGMDIWDNSLSYLNGNGQLVLDAEWNEAENRVHSGAVCTNDSASFGYGYYEASVRFPVAPGTWGAFWIMAGDVLNVDGTSSDGIEIDIIESINSEDGCCNHALHWDGYGNDIKKDSRTHSNLDIYDGEFHTFGLWRTETDYIFYVDGKETWRSQGGGICPLGGKMLLTMESSAWAGGGTDTGINALPARTEVDYVRVWASNPYSSEAKAEKALNIKLRINDPIMTVNGEDKPIDSDGTTPVIVNGRTFLPVRAVVEELGGEVLWDGETQTVTLNRGGNTVVLQIDDPTAYLNGEPHVLDTAPVIIGEKTMLPIRFVAESFNLNVGWNNDIQEVTIQNSAARPENYTAKTQAINIMSANNARQLGGYPCIDGRRIKENVLFRSGMLSWLSPKDANTLAEQYGIKYIVDFRTEAEKAENPDVGINGAQYISIPVYGGKMFSDETEIKLGEIEPEDGDNLKRSIAYARNGIITERYERLLLVDHVQAEYSLFFDVLLAAEEGEPIIFHSAQGKDRAGIASALLLIALGADEDMVMRDYLISNEAYASDIAEMRTVAEANGLDGDETVELLAATKGVDEKYLSVAFDSVKKKYGSMDNFLRERLGLTDEERKALREKFLEQ